MDKFLFERKELPHRFLIISWHMQNKNENFPKLASPQLRKGKEHLVDSRYNTRHLNWKNKTLE